MKYVVSTALMTLCLSVLFAQEIVESAGIKFELPNNQWSLTQHIEQPNLEAFLYNRDTIIDSEGREISVTLSVLVEPVLEDLDVVMYSFHKRDKIPFDVTKVLSHEDGSMQLKYAVGYYGEYEDRGLVHQLYIIHAINNGFGIVVIMDSTKEIFPQVADEFDQVFYSFERL